MTKLKLTQFTDPMCSWCYGSEPAMKKIEYLMEDNIEINYTLGLMLPSPEAVLGTGELAKIRLNQVKSGLDDEFNRVKTTTEMPFDISNMKTMNVEDFTTFPMSIAYEAVKITNPQKASIFLSRLRQAMHADNLKISNYEVLRELAGEFVDLDKYDESISSGMAEEKLNEDIAECRKMNVTGFPTILLEYGDQKGIINGFQRYEGLVYAINQISNGEININKKEGTLENVQEFISKFNRVAEIELKTAFDFDNEELEEVVNKLIDSGAYKIDKSKFSYFIREIPVMNCDPVSGVCKIN